MDLFDVHVKLYDSIGGMTTRGEGNIEDVGEVKLETTDFGIRKNRQKGFLLFRRDWLLLRRQLKQIMRRAKHCPGSLASALISKDVCFFPGGAARPSAWESRHKNEGGFGKAPRVTPAVALMTIELVKNSRNIIKPTLRKNFNFTWLTALPVTVRPVLPLDGAVFSRLPWFPRRRRFFR